MSNLTVAGRMWNAWLANELPNEIFADWAEENGFKEADELRNFSKLSMNLIFPLYTHLWYFCEKLNK